MMRCRYAQWKLTAALDTDGVVGARWVARHIERCASCREFDRRVRKLDATLRCSIESAGPFEVPARGSAVQWWLAPAFVAAAAIVFGIWSYGLGGGVSTHFPSQVASSPRAGVIAAESSQPRASWRGEAWRRVHVAVDANLLAREWRALSRDGQRGFDALLAIGGVKR